MNFIDEIQIWESSPYAINGTTPERSKLERAELPFDQCPCGQSIIVPIWFSEGSLRVRMNRANAKLHDTQFVLIRHSTGGVIGFELAHVPKRQGETETREPE